MPVSGFSNLFSSTEEGNRSKVAGPRCSLNISGNLHLTRKDHCCKYIFQFVTAETHKWRSLWRISTDSLGAGAGKSSLATSR